MIKSVTVKNYLGDSIKLELARPALSGFIVQSITGLGPGKADINTTEISTTDGGLFNSARVPKRNIVISLKYYFWGSDTIEQIRYKSYKYFPIKRKVILTIETDTRTAKIEGYVETNDPTIFDKEEGSDISIICPDPSFYSAGIDEINTTVFAGVESVFEFPFEDVNDDSPTLLMGYVQSRSEYNIIYEGDSEVGMIINIHALGSVSNITIYNTGIREMMKIDTVKLEAITGSAIIAGDDITISTIKGDKYITLLREGELINIINCLDKDSAWLQLAKGDNIIAYTAETGAANLQFIVANQILYEGV